MPVRPLARVARLTSTRPLADPYVATPESEQSTPSAQRSALSPLRFTPAQHWCPPRGARRSCDRNGLNGRSAAVSTPVHGRVLNEVGTPGDRLAMRACRDAILMPPAGWSGKWRGGLPSRRDRRRELTYDPRYKELTLWNACGQPSVRRGSRSSTAGLRRPHPRRSRHLPMTMRSAAHRWCRSRAGMGLSDCLRTRPQPVVSGR